MLGVTDAAVSQWEMDKTKPSSDKLLELPALLKINALWLFYGVGLPEQPGNATIPHLSQVGVYRVPKVSAAAAAADLATALANPTDHVPAINGGQPVLGEFALDVWNDANGPEFTVGDYVILRASITPQPGDYVLAAVGAEQAPEFAQLGRGSTGGWVLHYRNALWGMRPLQGPDRIVAVMHAHVRKIRRTP